MAATLASAASRACSSGIRSGSGESDASGWRARTRSRTSCRIAASSSACTSVAPFLGPLLKPVGGNFGMQSAARGEFAGHRGARRLSRCHHVTQKPVYYILIKDSQISIGEQIHLGRLQLEAPAPRHIAKRQRAEIGLSGFGAYRSELRNRDLDFVIGKLVGPGFDVRQLSVDTGRRMFVGVSPLHACATARASRSRNIPTSATTPTAWPVPRSLTLVASAGLISPQTILTQLGNILPVAIECSMEPRHSTRPAPFKCSA